MAAIARTVATLRIYGDNLDPDEVSKLLGIQPTASRRKGESRATGSGREHVERDGSWRLKAVEKVPGDLSSQLRELLVITTPDLSVWAMLSQRFRCDVFCGLFMNATNEGEDLEADVLLALGERGLRLSLDIYDPTPD